MKLLIGIDDTDDLKGISSVRLLQNIGTELQEKGLGEVSPVTSYQLLLRDDIPCTKDNISACCEWNVNAEDYGKVEKFAAEYIEENCAAGSEPGLCIIKLDDLPEVLTKRLSSYGKCAKTMIMRPWEAYKLAESMPELIHLSEHGGAGSGVIGALAGCGLRLLERNE